MKCLRICCCLLFLFGLQKSYSQSAEFTVSGTVRDSATHEPLIGVSISVKSKPASGTVTDEGGHFIVKLASGNETLLLRMINYATKEVPVNNRREHNILLSTISSQLGEVLIVGYTEQSVKKNTAAISKLDAAELKNNPNPNPVQALQGKVAGVSIPITQGQPGIGATNIIIRGGTKPNAYGSGLGNNNGESIGASDGSDPLVIIDGVFRSMNDVNPDDIESLQVMKDAASTAIYGARGANGVIVIKTKRGRLNTRSSITLSHRTTWETQARDYDYLSASEYLRLARTTVANTDDAINKDNLLNNGGFSAGTRVYTQPGQYGKNIYLTALYDNIVAVEGQQYVDNLLANGWQTMDDPINPGTKLLYADNHYQDMLWKTGLSNTDNVTISGGTDKADYNFSMGYTDQKGVLVGTAYKRYNVLGNFGYQAYDNLKLDFMVNYQNVIPKYVDAYQNDLVRAIRITPLIRIFKDDGNPTPGELYTVRNRFHTLKYDDMRTSTERMVTRMAADWTIIKGLHFKPSLSYLIDDYTEMFMRKGTPADEVQPSMQRWKDDYTNSSRQLMIDQVLQYDFNLQQDHHVTLLAGMNYTRNTNHVKDMGSQRATNDYIYTIDEPTTTVINGSVFSNVVDFATTLGETRSASFFGQFSYDYKMKYILGGTLRYDGFSNFAPDNKYALFPSLSAGWNIDKESFWKSNIVSSLKVRGSWGIAGLSGLSLSDTYGKYSSASYAMYAGIIRAGLSNPGLRWESTVTTDLAVDAGFLKDRITLSVDYYNKLTKDRLTSKPLPAEAPFTTITYNNGALRNRGVEVAIGAAIIRSPKFSWNANFSFAFNRTVITQLPQNNRAKNRQGGDIIFDKTSGKEIEAGGFAEGERPYGIWGYNVLGVFATNEEAAAWNARIKDNLASPQGIIVGKRGGDFIFEDVNNDGVIDTKDQVFLGYRNPDKIGGIQNTFNYKGFSLRITADYALGHIISNGALARSMGQGRAFNEGAPSQAIGPDVWKTQGDEGKKYARFSFADYDFGQRNYLRSATLGNNNGYGSDVSVMFEKGDFLALREITLSYDFPAAITNRFKAAGLNVFASVYNVAYLTGYTGLNPEIYSGFDPGGYPRPRQFSLGANLRF
ncbi:SusC/RagA family TonB-linked outer membrane protein [Chitinophaga sp. GbtcB8]|uniref:SusC/RagA family TonB-linked outer membrane protein n=1 Tax=Chitinophaga sp. GbtcB8 TaxID=2824753 RepID=UPI001C302B06|nr:SusC/RagA family TonB-linked outer membrane protein [Chitinophaga sp. GbtcB8]